MTLRSPQSAMKKRSGLLMNTASKSRSMSPTELTVAETIARYVEWLKLHRATGPEVEQRAALHILPQLGAFKVSELTTHQLNEWRDKLGRLPCSLSAAIWKPRKHRPLPKTKDEQRAAKSVCKQMRHYPEGSAKSRL